MTTLPNIVFTCCSQFNIATSVHWTLYFFLVHLLLWAKRLVHFLIFFFFIKSIIHWPSPGSFSDNTILVLMLLECPKLLIESYWHHFAFYSILYLYPSLGHYYSCSQALVLHFCWQFPNLFFSTYWPSAHSPFAAWLSLWHSGSEWMSSNFLELNGYKNKL